MHSATRSGGSRATSLLGSGASVCTFAITAATPLPAKGSSPVSASKSSTPTLYMSERPSSGSPDACSGDM